MATAASTRRVLGANDRVRVGFIGIGLIGKRHLLDFQTQPDCEIAGISEVSDERMDEGVTASGNNPARFPDFRRMLDRPDIDAIVVSTPDHWHALMTILACAAGKDVYVEKPLTHAYREGEWMLEAANAHKRVVQVGTQQRSGRHYQRARSLVRDGHIGDVRGASIGAFRNITPGFTKPVGSPLSAAQWDMWLGPAPAVPFDPARGLYHFRWFNDYSGGQTTNLLAHEIDIVQWVTGEIPARVAAFAQRRSLTGFGETPDVLDAIFDYPTFLASWSSREVAAGGKGGTGNLRHEGHAQHQSPRLRDCARQGADAGVTNPALHAAAGGTRAVGYRTEAVKDEGYDQVRDQFQPHVRNFLDAVKSRQQPVSDLASAHQTSLACHLANVAARLGRVVNWDATAQRDRRRSRRERPSDEDLPCALGPGAGSRGESHARMITRRAFLGLAIAMPLARRRAGDRTSMCLAYTSFAVRMLQGRDILKSTAAALPADALFDLCDKFDCGGAQLDWSQIVSFEPAALLALRKRVEASHLALELSVPSKYLESARGVRRDGPRRDRARRRAHPRGVALRTSLRDVRDTRRVDGLGREVAHHARSACERRSTTRPIIVGIENHKDWHAAELVELLRLIASPRVGACVDFGNNISLLESPLETVRTLAPFAVTTHLKDMAVKPTAEGFGLSEVPLGDGFLPLAEIIAILRAQRPGCPDVPRNDHARSAARPVQDRSLLGRDRSADAATYCRGSSRKCSARHGRATCRRSRASAPRRRSPLKTRMSGDRSTTPGAR